MSPNNTSPNEVIEAYVVDVMRRVPGKDRNEVGLELRGLLTEMLDERAESNGQAADEAMVLAMLRDFGTPADIASRYRPPGLVIIPAEQTRSFVMLSVIGVVLQWALTLPGVFDGSLSMGGWWLTWGLGAFWWPGFQAMMSLLVAWLRSLGLFASMLQPTWKPRIVDPDRVNRGALVFGLASFAIAMGFMIALPWLVGRMPGPLPRVLAFDPGFLHARAWPAVVLWAGMFATLVLVVVNGRRTALTRRLELGFSLGFIALLAWWLAAGNLFIEPATNEGARGGIALVIVFIAIDIAIKLYRGRPRIRSPHGIR